MRRTHYQRERSKLDARAKELKAELDHVNKKISALDVVWNEIFNQESGRPISADSPVTPDEHFSDDPLSIEQSEPIALSAPTNGAMGRLIETLASEWSGDFRVRQIEEKILSLHPTAVIDRTTIAGKLRKLVGEGKLDLIEQGKGRKASVFRSHA